QTARSHPDRAASTRAHAVDSSSITATPRSGAFLNDTPSYTGSRSGAPRPQEAAVSEAVHTHTNRLAGESSPYLLQHAHNPVDWYPWGEAAFARARAEDKAILLSVGYAACHWCHVMEH